MAIQVHVPPGQASGSRSIWHLHRARVLHYFLALCLWRPARSGGPPRLCVHPEVSGEPSPAACPPPPVETRSREKKAGRARQGARRALYPRPAAPGAHEQCADPRPPHSPPRSAPHQHPRGWSWPWQRLPRTPGAAARAPGPPRPAARTDRCAPRSALLAAPHGGPKPLRRPRRPPPSNSSAAPGPRARPAEGEEGLAGLRGAASRGPRGGDGDRGGGGEGLQRLARAAWEARA